MSEKINRDFLNAVARIESGEVLHPILRLKKAEGKQLKLNATNVALEAGHSRTLIGTENSQYPQIRRRVAPGTALGDEPVSAPAAKRRGESTQQQIARLLEEKNKQEVVNRILSTRLAQAAQEIHLLEKEIKAFDDRLQ
jgi:hypothetical protein